MGKARILEAHGEGRYTIEIIEARERAEFAKQEAEARIQTLRSEILSLEQRITSAQAAVIKAAVAQDAAINQYQEEMQEAGESSVNLEAFAGKLLEAVSQRDALRAELRSKELRIAADEALVARVNALPPLRQVQAWCADFTEDLSGEVATAEVPGEIGSVIIKPGFEGNAWRATEDGAMQPALASTPAATFYNLAMLPGWQKWRPTFRIATITSLQDDTCSISLDATTSSQQGLGVNARASYSNVPILYMDCNGSAFEEGDQVLVAFAGNVEGPTVVGFEQEPRTCSLEILAFSTSDFRGFAHKSDWPEVQVTHYHQSANVVIATTYTCAKQSDPNKVYNRVEGSSFPRRTVRSSKDFLATWEPNSEDPYYGSASADNTIIGNVPIKSVSATMQGQYSASGSISYTGWGGNSGSAYPEILCAPGLTVTASASVSGSASAYTVVETDIFNRSIRLEFGKSITASDTQGPFTDKTRTGYLNYQVRYDTRNFSYGPNLSDYSSNITCNGVRLPAGTVNDSLSVERIDPSVKYVKDRDKVYVYVYAYFYKLDGAPSINPTRYNVFIVERDGTTSIASDIPDAHRELPELDNFLRWFDAKE